MVSEVENAIHSPEIFGCSEPGEWDKGESNDGHPLTQGQVHAQRVHQWSQELQQQHIIVLRTKVSLKFLEGALLQIVH